MRIAALAAAEGHWNHLAGFGVIAEAGRIRHADELVFDDRFIDLQWLRHQRAQLIRISPVSDDEIFSLTEAVGSRWKRGARQRHCKSPRPHITFLHGDFPREQRRNQARRRFSVRPALRRYRTCAPLRADPEAEAPRDWPRSGARSGNRTASAPPWCAGRTQNP